MPGHSRTMQLSIILRLLLIGCLISGLIYAWLAVRHYWAYRLSTNPDQTSLERAISLEPTNAGYYDLLGRNLLFIAQKPYQATTTFEKATQLNPYSSSYLLDLAQAYYEMGDTQRNIATLHKAIAIDPKTMDVAWNAGNFFLVQGNVTEALQQFAMVLRNDHTLTPSILSVSWNSLEDVNAIEKILPPDPSVHLAFVKVLVDRGQMVAAHTAWLKLLQLQREFDYHDALFYVDSLINKREITMALEAWKQLSSTSPSLSRYTSSNNLLVNGAFKEVILNGGFDWHYTPSSTPSVALDEVDVDGNDNREFSKDDRSILISYSSSGVDSGLYQYVPVDPNTRYTISAWVKSEDLETANGPTVAAVDGFDNTVYATTDETVGTTPWHRISKEFSTGSATKLVVIRFIRNPGTTGIRGQFWITEVCLRPAVQ